MFKTKVFKNEGRFSNKSMLKISYSATAVRVGTRQFGDSNSHLPFKKELSL